MRLTVKPNGQIALTVPVLILPPVVERFLDAHYQWMLRQRAKVLDRLEKQKKVRFLSGEQHLLWGNMTPLRTEATTEKETVQILPDEILLQVHPDSTVESRKKLLYQGYYAQFRPVLQQLVDKWSQRLNTPPIALTIRLMRTEWGSCTPHKNRMTFNVDLARMPIECVEYVVIHEFTHLDRCDHSPAFWALCDQRLASVGLPPSKQLRARMRALTTCGGAD